MQVHGVVAILRIALFKSLDHRGRKYKSYLDSTFVPNCKVKLVRTYIINISIIYRGKKKNKKRKYFLARSLKIKEKIKRKKDVISFVTVDDRHDLCLLTRESISFRRKLQILYTFPLTRETK